MCLGGHLAYRCAFDNRVAAAVCYFATDIHSHSLGQGKNDDSLDRAGDIKSELVMVRVFFFLFFFFSPPSPLHFESHDEIKTLTHVGTIRIQIFGKKDSHVPPEGRDLIRKTLHEKGVLFSFYEVAHAQRK